MQPALARCSTACDQVWNINCKLRLGDGADMRLLEYLLQELHEPCLTPWQPGKSCWSWCLALFAMLAINHQHMSQHCDCWLMHNAIASIKDYVMVGLFREE